MSRTHTGTLDNFQSRESNPLDYGARDLSIVHLVYSPDGELEEFFFRKVAELDEYLPKGYSVTFLLYADPYTKGAIVFCVTLYLTIVYLTYRRDNS